MNRGSCAISLALAAAVAGCAFEPRGEGVAGDDALGDDGAPSADAPAGFDGPADTPVDAPADAPIDAPGTCPVTYDLAVGSSRYRFVTSLQSLGGAIADCVDDAPGLTHLATFESPGDLATTHANRGGNEMFWVHATCSPLAGISCGDELGWSWQPDGEPVASSLWGTDEPNNPAVEHSAITFKDSGDWRLNNVIAAELHAYLCECGN